jgi:hypothetical protein
MTRKREVRCGVAALATAVPRHKHFHLDLSSDLRRYAVSSESRTGQYAGLCKGAAGSKNRASRQPPSLVAAPIRSRPQNHVRKKSIRQRGRTLHIRQRGRGLCRLARGDYKWERGRCGYVMPTLGGRFKRRTEQGRL